MAQFSGPQYKGAMRARRATKRQEAEARNDKGKELLKEVFEDIAKRPKYKGREKEVRSALRKVREMHSAKANGE